MRIWCVGGWWFQIAGQPRQRVEGDDAASALLRHLALASEEEIPKSQLRLWLSRRPNEQISVASLNTAISRLRGMLKQAAGEGEGTEGIAKSLVPHAGLGLSPDGASSEATYRLGEAVWVDLYHAASPRLGTYLLGPRHEAERRRGRGAKTELQGRDRLQREVEEGLASAQGAHSGEDLEAHLKGLTPPISSLTALVPMALDRLRRGRMLSILAAPDSGRMHLAEAVELGAQIYCGRSTEEIREKPKGGTDADYPDLRAEQPGHLCVIDLTRPLEQKQIERLEAVGEPKGGGPPPALLVIREGAIPPDLSFLEERWTEEEPIELPTPGRGDVLEAFLIGTEGNGALEDRRQRFEVVWHEYERSYNAPMGLRAAASAASAAERGVPPQGAKLPGPPAQDVEYLDLPTRARRLTRCLGWFGNRPFGLEEARWASGDDDLEESDLFAVATKIPGGKRLFELRPQLIGREPPGDAQRRICQYLIAHEDVEPIIERWPGRALGILGRGSVSVEDRLDLALILVETCRDQGLAKRLVGAMKQLRDRAGPGLDERLARFEIERARLLTYLGSFEKADAVLSEVTETHRSGGEWKGLKARAHLRRAIVASRLGDVERARREAQQAHRHGPLRVKVENFRGWEATHTGSFEEAISRFERALANGGDDEERADAVIGMSRALIRLGRPAKAEEALAQLKGLELRRHSRDRVARVSASLCHLKGIPSEGIDRYIDPALLSASSNYSSASAVLLEASAFLHLEAEEVVPAAEDIERSLSLLANSGGKPNSATRYVRALIYEAEAAAARGQAGPEILRLAREEAGRCANEEIRNDPWARARADTLRGRLALRAEDWSSLAHCLGSAVESHRELGLVCPGVLAQTLDLAAQAAARWQMESDPDQLAELARGLDPMLRSSSAPLEDSLTAMAPVLAAVEAGPPPPSLDETMGALSVLGRVGQTMMEAASQAQQARLRLRVLVPRSLDGLAEGVYEVVPGSESLFPCPALPGRAAAVVTPSSERRLVRRYATSVLLAFCAEEDSRQSYLALGEWLADVKAAARDHGVAVWETADLDPEALAFLADPVPDAVLGVALAELPALS